MRHFANVPVSVQINSPATKIKSVRVPMRICGNCICKLSFKTFNVHMIRGSLTSRIEESIEIDGDTSFLAFPFQFMPASENMLKLKESSSLTYFFLFCPRLTSQLVHRNFSCPDKKYAKSLHPGSTAIILVSMLIFGVLLPKYKNSGTMNE